MDRFCVQTEDYKKRFKQLGISEDKLVVTGTIKLDANYPQLDEEEATAWKTHLGVSEKQLVLCIGSTHEPEEEQLLDALEPVWSRYPSLKVLLVPRHPERFQAVASLLKTKNIPFIAYSNIDQKTGSEKVVLIDQMGLLTRCYQVSTAAIVAGSYVQRVGGHNILEPLWYGVPVIYGPYMHSQKELDHLVKKYQAGVQLPVEHIGSTLHQWFDQPEISQKIGLRGQKLLHQNRGATEKTWDLCLSLIEEGDKIKGSILSRGGAGVSSLGS